MNRNRRNRKKDESKGVPLTLSQYVDSGCDGPVVWATKVGEVIDVL
jgi:hypothetical protein